MSELEALLSELAADSNLRRAFAQSPATVLRARGYDLTKFTVPDQMDLAALEAQLQAWAMQRHAGITQQTSGDPASTLNLQRLNSDGLNSDGSNSSDFGSFGLNSSELNSTESKESSLLAPIASSSENPALFPGAANPNSVSQKDVERVRHSLREGRRLLQEAGEEARFFGNTQAIPPFNVPISISARLGGGAPASLESSGPIRNASKNGSTTESGALQPAAPSHPLHDPAPESSDSSDSSKPVGAGTQTTVREYPSAWFGSNGTAVSRAIITGAEASRLVPETIVGSDDRVRVTDPVHNPFRWLCRLVIVAANGTLWSGTGWLVGPRLILTAGHCVYMHNQGGWVQRIQVFLYNDKGELDVPIDADDAASVTGWVTDADPEQDYAAISLPSGFSALGWFGFGSFPDQELLAGIANIAGFPVDKPAGTLWGHARKLSEVRPNVLFYEIDTYGGMSGAPVICWNGGDYVAVGIHNYGDIAGNRATRINQNVYLNIEAWLAAYA